jgi:hypothetical protein
MKNEKIAFIAFLVLALFISLVLGGLPFLARSSESSLSHIEGIRTKNPFPMPASSTPALPTPTVNATQDKYNMLDGALTNIANHAITESGKEEEVLNEKKEIMEVINELMSIIQTGKTINGIDANLEKLEEMLSLLFKPLAKILKYTNFVNKFNDPTRRTKSIDIHKNLSIFESNLFDICMLAWSKIG